MNNIIEYKNYVGSVEFSEKDCVFFGKVLGIHSLVSYEGTNAKELIDDFHNAVNTYLEECKQAGKNPEKSYKGSFNVRVSPELHKNAALYALTHNISLNTFVEESIKEALVLN